MMNADNMSEYSPAEEKALIRKRIRGIRRSLSAEQITEASAAVAKKVTALTAFADSKLMLSYMPAKNELDVTLINRVALAAGKRIAFPLCIENGGLRLLVPESADAFTVGSYGILEPDPDRSYEVTAEELDLIIVPGVAFSDDLRRLGQGGGYYDRLLAKTNAFTIGVGYDFQLLDSLPAEPHDLPLDMIVLPSLIFGRDKMSN